MVTKGKAPPKGPPAKPAPKQPVAKPNFVEVDHAMAAQLAKCLQQHADFVLQTKATAQQYAQLSKEVKAIAASLAAAPSPMMSVTPIGMNHDAASATPMQGVIYNFGT